MGKIIKYFSAIVVFLLTFVLLIRFYLGSPDSALYKILLVQPNTYYLNKLLGIIPEKFEHRFSMKVLETNNDLKIINIIDEHSPIKSNFILVKNGSEERFMKAYPFELLGSKKSNNEVAWDMHMSHLIDLNVFNQYITNIGTTNLNEIIAKYCYFLSNPEDSSSYKILKSTLDLDSLILDFPLDNKDAITSQGYTLIALHDLQDLEFVNSCEMVYCWFYNKGIVRFHFTFDGTRIVDVNSCILGLIGNEFPTCC